MASVRMENLTKRPRKWVARLRVPADVTQALGKSVFSWSTGEKDPHRAAVKAKPVIARWKAEIEAARRGALTPLRCELRDLTAALRQEERTGGENMDLALT